MPKSHVTRLWVGNGRQRCAHYPLSTCNRDGGSNLEPQRSYSRLRAYTHMMAPPTSTATPTAINTLGAFRSIINPPIFTMNMPVTVDIMPAINTGCIEYKR